MHPQTQQIHEVAHDTKHSNDFDSNDFDSNESMPGDPDKRPSGEGRAVVGCAAG